MSNKIIRVGISHGDINGIGYELILKAFEDARMFEDCIPVVYGSSKALAYHRKHMNLPSVNSSVINHAKDAGNNRLNIVNCGNEDVVSDFSGATPDGDKLADLAMERALADLSEGLIDVLVAAPSNRDDALSAKLNAREKKNNTLQILVSDTFRVALATGRMPLSEVSAMLTPEFVAGRIKDLQTSLIRDFMVTLPRIAVLSYNPKAGEGEGQFGKEETEAIIPGIKAAQDKGVYCFGPYAGEELFGSDEYKKYDAILAMYYDQGQVPFRSISRGEGVLCYSNLPQVLTAPDLNVSYEKAGKGEASPSAFRNALYWAIDILNNRRFDSEINANPLRKQYFERGSDNEKLDLTKEEN